MVVNATTEARPDVTIIPRATADDLARTALAGARLFYSDPENERKFLAWLLDRRGQAAVDEFIAARA